MLEKAFAGNIRTEEFLVSGIITRAKGVASSWAIVASCLAAALLLTPRQLPPHRRSSTAIWLGSPLVLKIRRISFLSWRLAPQLRAAFAACRLVATESQRHPFSYTNVRKSRLVGCSKPANTRRIPPRRLVPLPLRLHWNFAIAAKIIKVLVHTSRWDIIPKQ